MLMQGKGSFKQRRGASFVACKCASKFLDRAAAAEILGSPGLPDKPLRNHIYYQSKRLADRVLALTVWGVSSTQLCAGKDTCDSTVIRFLMRMPRQGISELPPDLWARVFELLQPQLPYDTFQLYEEPACTNAASDICNFQALQQISADCAQLLKVDCQPTQFAAFLCDRCAESSEKFFQTTPTSIICYACQRLFTKAVGIAC